MRHRKLAGGLGRTTAHRRAMFRNLVTSLLEHERVQTTDAKAKQVRRIAERMITLGKRGDLHARRQALRVVRTPEVASKLFSDLAERYRERPGGYTRVIKLRRRVGDNAPLSIVELVEGGVPESEAPRRRRKAGRSKAGAAEAAKPAAPRSGGRGAKAKPESQEAGAEAEKPKRARRTRKASEEAPSRSRRKPRDS